jgi:hypothetical protein
MYRCYEYGCKPPTSGEKDAVEQMFLRNRLWNQFVEIDRRNQERREVILRVPEQDEAEAMVERLRDLRKKLKAAKKKLPRKQSDDATLDLASQIKDAEARLRQRAAMIGAIADGTLTEAETTRACLKLLWGRIKEQRRIVATTNRERLKEVEDQRRGECKAVRETFAGLYWVNYDEVRQNYEDARSRAMKTGAVLHFHRFDGTGKITARYDKGGESVFALTPPDERAWLSRQERRRHCLTVAKIRTYGAVPSSIVVEVPVYQHRRLPDDAVIRTASLVRERVASQMRWKLVVSVKVPEPAKREGPSVSVTLYHIRPVATWTGDDGRDGILVLPESLIGNFQKCDELRSLIDQKFNAARGVLVEWLKEAKAPDWLRERTQYLGLWKSPRLMVLLTMDWQHFPGDEMIYAALLAWQRKHQHLWEWKQNLQDQAVRARREAYRCCAAEMAKRYAVLRITDRDLARRKKRPEAEVDRPVIAARTRDIAAHGVLRSTLQNAFLREGGTVYADRPAAVAVEESAQTEAVEEAIGA